MALARSVGRRTHGLQGCGAGLLADHPAEGEGEGCLLHCGR